MSKRDQKKDVPQRRDLDRRRFLTAAGAASAGTLAGVGAAARPPGAATQQTDDSPHWLLALLAEVILAPQGVLPSVADTEVDRFARDRFRAAGGEEQLELALAAVSMETEALFGSERGFAELSAAERIQIVERIRRAETTTSAWMGVGIGPDEFYRRLRFHLVDGYYSHPRVQQAIGFPGAVQFVGHPDFTEMPEPGDE